MGSRSFFSPVMSRERSGCCLTKSRGITPTRTISRSRRTAGLAYVTCGGADQVLVVDIAKAIDLINKTPPWRTSAPLRNRLSTSRQFVAARIPVGTNPYGIAMAPDGKLAFVANHLGNSVSIINTGFAASRGCR